MNRRPQGLLISKAVTGFLQFKAAEGLSARTTDSYRRMLAQWRELQKDVEVSSITTQQLRDYLNYRRTEYVPKRITGNNEQNDLPPFFVPLFILVFGTSPGTESRLMPAEALLLALGACIPRRCAA